MYVMAFVVVSVVGAVYLFGFTSIGSGRVSGGNLLEEVAKRPMTMLGMLVTSLVVLFMLAMFGALLSPVPWRQRLRLTAPALSRGQMVIGAVGAIAIGAVFTLADALGLLPRSSTLESLAEALAGLTGEHFIWAVLIIGIMPGMSEEFLFRGYIQTRLSQRWRIGWSIAAAALMFAVYHMDFSQGLLAFGMGLYLGWLAERAGSIVPAILAHSANNTVAVLVSGSKADFESELLCWGLLILAAVVVLWCLRQLRRGDAVIPVDVNPCQPDPAGDEDEVH
jgi:membrane protease YdiL (CAAX protease family)